jgi:hypothetical protein
MEYVFFLPLFGPGLALVFYFIRDDRFDWLDRIILGLGLSLAFYPLLLLLFYVAGIPINPRVIYTVLVASFVWLAWQLYAIRKRSDFIEKITLRELKVDSGPAWFVLAIVLGLSAYARITVVKDLVIPMWADSYHHTLISQLLIDNHGLFSSWLPYVPLKTFTYHFGFHGLVVGYHWLSGVELTRAVIVTGQVINFLTVLASYLLAYQLTRKRWAGNFAALFVGLVSPMPFFYFNWGRYPQLSGLALLPIAIILTLNLLDQKKVDLKLGAATSLAIIGLALSHYVVSIFFLLFGGLFSLYKFIEAHSDRQAWHELALKLGLVGVIGGILSAPWMWNLLKGRSLFIAAKTIERGASNPAIQAHNVINSFTFFLNGYWYILALIGLGWAIWRREKWVILVGIWASSLLLLANPHYLYLPGTGLINNFSVFISLFLPISVLLGNLVADAIIKIQSWQPWTVGLVVVLLLVLGFRGLTFRLASFQPHHQLVLEQDLQAMAWIEQNTPENAKFLVNEFLAYGGSTVVGADAGWWLPFLANRQTNLPPLIYIKETADEPDYFDEIKRFQQQTTMARLLTGQGWQALQAAGITHIYLGQQTEGPVWYTPAARLDAQQLEASPYYQLLYHQDNVAILEVKTETP